MNYISEVVKQLVPELEGKGVSESGTSWIAILAKHNGNNYSNDSSTCEDDSLKT
jgi:hypothetical protein